VAAHDKGAAMSNSQPPKQWDIQTVDGRQRCYVDGYWIRHYPQMQKNDLETALKWVGNFEWRFQKAVENGMETTGDDARIESQRGLYEAAQKEKERIANKTSREFKKAEIEENAFGGLLAVSLVRRMVNNIKKHITLRIRKIDDPQQLHSLEKQIDADMRSAALLFKYVRRAGGAEDKDRVLAEMQGEPLFVFNITLNAANDELATMFHHNRYTKLASAWRNIDEASGAIKRAIASSPTLKSSGLMDIIDNMSMSAKARSELMRSDLPDYDLAAVQLRASRNQIRDFKVQHSHAASVTAHDDRKILQVVKDYSKLVYDIAHVRAPRTASTKELIRRVDNLLGPGLSLATG
jgi:hypothetical protein